MLAQSLIPLTSNHQFIRMITLIILSVIIIVSGPMSQLSYALDAVQQTKQTYTEVITSRIAELKADQEALEVGTANGTTSANPRSLCYVQSSTRASTCTFDEGLRNKLKDILRKQILALQDTQNRVNATNDPLELKNLGKSLDAQYGLNWITVAQARAIIALEATNTSLKKTQEGWTTASTNYARVAECSQYLSGGTTKDKKTNSSDSSAQTTTVDASKALISPSKEQKKVKEGNNGSTEITLMLERTGNLELTSTAKWKYDPLLGNQSTNRDDITNSADVIESVDYPLSGTVTFKEKQSTATIKMSVKGDTDVELDEVLRIALSDPSDGTVLWGGDNGDKNYLEAIIQNEDIAEGETAPTNTEVSKPAVCEGLDSTKVTAAMIQNDMPAALTLNTMLNSTASTTLQSLTALAEAQTTAFTKRIESVEAQIGQGGLASIGNVASIDLEIALANSAVGTIETTRKALDSVASGLVTLVGNVESSLKNMASFADKLIANVLAGFMYQSNPVSTVVTRSNGKGNANTDRSDRNNSGSNGNTRPSNESSGNETGAFVRLYQPGWYLNSQYYCQLDISRVKQDNVVVAAANALVQLCNSKMPGVQLLTSLSSPRPIQIMVVGQSYKDSSVTDDKWCSDDTERPNISRTFTNKGRIYVCGVGYFKNNPTDTGWIVKDMTRFTQRYADKNPKQWYVDAIPLYVQDSLGLSSKYDDKLICKPNESFDSSSTCAASFLKYLTSYDTLLDFRKMLTTIHLRANADNTNINSFILSKASNKDKINYNGLMDLFNQKCKNNQQCQDLGTSS